MHFRISCSRFLPRLGGVCVSRALLIRASGAASNTKNVTNCPTKAESHEPESPDLDGFMHEAAEDERPL